MNALTGILPALVTPLDADGALMRTSFEKLLERVFDAGASGVYVCGQTGEGLHLPLAVRKDAAEVACSVSPAGRNVVVHVGAHNPADALELAAHAKKAGAHAISSLPPLGTNSFPAVRQYYESLAHTGDLPFLVYYYPQLTTVIGSVEQILDLCSIPNVVGLKFTDFDLYRLSLIRRAGHTVFNGRDEVLAAGLLMGASGGIGTFYNLMPEVFVAVFEAAQSGRWEETRVLQQRINTLIQIVLHFPAIPAVKAILGWSGIDCGISMPKSGVLTADQERDLRAALA
ncbi:MAG: dihydrodipicolinate synthase family protein [Bryobacteraceae bacterium]